MILNVYTYIKSYQTVHFKCVHDTACWLYLYFQSQGSLHAAKTSGKEPENYRKLHTQKTTFFTLPLILFIRVTALGSMRNFIHPDLIQSDLNVYGSVFTMSTTTLVCWSLFNPNYLHSVFLSSFFFLLFRAKPLAYEGSQARGWIRAVAAGLCHSHSNTRSEPCLQPTPQLMTTLDP